MWPGSRKQKVLQLSTSSQQTRRWRMLSSRDVDAIYAHYARDSTHYADLVVERLVAAVERLADHPRSGRGVPELGDESIREVIHVPYRLPPASWP